MSHVLFYVLTSGVLSLMCLTCSTSTRLHSHEKAWQTNIKWLWKVVMKSHFVYSVDELCFSELRCCADLSSRNAHPQRRVEPVVNDPTIVPDLPVEWTGMQNVVLSFNILIFTTCPGLTASPLKLM